MSFYDQLFGPQVAENEDQTQQLERQMGMTPRPLPKNHFAEDEGQTQALERAMGMTPSPLPFGLDAIANFYGKPLRPGPIQSAVQGDPRSFAVSQDPMESSGYPMPQPGPMPTSRQGRPARAPQSPTQTYAGGSGNNFDSGGTKMKPGQGVEAFVNNGGLRAFKPSEVGPLDMPGPVLPHANTGRHVGFLEGSQAAFLNGQGSAPRYKQEDLGPMDQQGPVLPHDLTGKKVGVIEGSQADGGRNPLAQLASLFGLPFA